MRPSRGDSGDAILVLRQGQKLGKAARALHTHTHTQSKCYILKDDESLPMPDE